MPSVTDTAVNSEGVSPLITGFMSLHALTEWGCCQRFLDKACHFGRSCWSPTAADYVVVHTFDGASPNDGMPCYASVEVDSRQL